MKTGSTRKAGALIWGVRLVARAGRAGVRFDNLSPSGGSAAPATRTGSCRSHQTPPSSPAPVRLAERQGTTRPISGCRSASCRFIAQRAWRKCREKWNVRIEEQATIEMPIMVNRMPPGTFSFRAENNSQTHKRHNNREGVEIAQRDRQRAINGFFNDEADTPLAAISNKTGHADAVQWATPCGGCKISYLRMPVAE